jgi:hypothetical protein
MNAAAEVPAAAAVVRATAEMPAAAEVATRFRVTEVERDERTENDRKTTNHWFTLSRKKTRNSTGRFSLHPSGQVRQSIIVEETSAILVAYSAHTIS